MFGNDYNAEYRPITYLGGYPIYATTLIILIYVVSLFATTICMAMGYEKTIPLYLMFDSRFIFPGGQVWRFFTYGFWNEPSFNFVIDMVMLVWFGFDLERFFGRKIFLRFYGILYLLQPFIYTLLSFVRSQGLIGVSGTFAVFLAFATLYPNAALLFNILAKWMAIVLVGIYTLQHIAARDIVGLAALWATVGYAYGFVRYEQGRISLPKFRWPGRRPKLRVLPSPASDAPREIPASEAEMDRLLDKIAKTGMASLTAKEKAQLEKAREALLRKDQD